LRGAVPAALRRAGYPPRTAREWVTARMPAAEEAKILRITAGVPVLRTLRLTCTDLDVPVEVLEIIFSADIYELEYELQIHEEES
jgi:GntR family transcriptional regulator